MENDNDDNLSNYEEVEYLPIDFCKVESMECFDEDSTNKTESCLQNFPSINETVSQRDEMLNSRQVSSTSSILSNGVTSNKVLFQRRSLNECNVPNCRKSSKHGVTLHRVPKANMGLVTFKNNEGRLVTMDRRRAWQTLAHLGMDEDAPEPDNRPGKICSEHFLPSDFKKSDFKRHLKTDVLPSQNLPDSPTLAVATGTRLTNTQMSEMERMLSEGRSANLAMYDVTDPSGKLVRVFTSTTSAERPGALQKTSEDVVVKQEVLEDLEMEVTCPPEDTCLVRELCRVCAGTSGNMVAIFDNEALLNNIKQFLKIEVQESDLLPLRVCEGCVSQLAMCQQLVVSCARAQSELLRKLDLEQQREAQARELQARKQKEAEVEAAKKKQASVVMIQGPTSLAEKIKRLIEANNQVMSTKELQSVSPVTNIPNPEIFCKLCNSGFFTIKSLKTHSLSEHDLHMCTNCSTNFPTDSQLKNHIDEVHVISCRYCNFKCRNTTNNEIKSHVRSFHKNKLPQNITFSKVSYEDITCKVCHIKFTRRDLIKTHYFWEHGIYACDVCVELFTMSEQQVEHTEEVHMIPCPCCPEKNYTHHRFKRHFNKEHKVQSSQGVSIPKTSQQIYECEFCKKGLTSKTFVRRHYYWSHFQYTCIICLQTFKTPELEEKHFKSHGNICICCEEKFANPEILSNHIKSQHPNFKPFSCEDCGDLFDKRSELNSHRPEHELLEKYLCDECGKGFKTYNVLIQHRFTHKSENEKGKVQCTYCNKKFVFSSQLKAHILKHTGEKTFHCKDCNKSFGRYEALRTHMTSYHTASVKQHKCNFCDSVFATTQRMKNHVKVIHSDSCVYKCSVCSRNFTNEEEIQVHISSHLESELLQFHQSYTKMFVLVCEYCDQVFSKKSLLKVHMSKHAKFGFRRSKLIKRKK